MRVRADRGAAVPEFVLVLALLIPIVVAIMQIALVMHVRNTITAAAATGARTGAGLDVPVGAAADRTRAAIADSIASRFADDVTARHAVVDGVRVVEVTVRADVPALGVVGPALTVEGVGHAVLQDMP